MKSVLLSTAFYGSLFITSEICIALDGFLQLRKSTTAGRFETLGVLRYDKPYERRDWIVDRCGRTVRYVIDYYRDGPISLKTNQFGKLVSNLQRSECHMKN